MIKLFQKKSNAGFSVIELLVTLFVAVGFLYAGYQLYTLVIKDSNLTRSEAIASNIAQQYLRQYSNGLPNVCVASNPLTDSAISSSGISNVLVTVAITCPYSARPSVSEVTVTIKYNSPQITLRNATYVDKVNNNYTIAASPTISSIYSGYDLLFCRFASNCSSVSGITADFSYQVAFTAKAGSKYALNMVQIDNTSTNWTSGTVISTNIAYSTPTAGASLSSNIITTTNAGETRVTFTGTGLLDKTLVARITQVDGSNNAISQSSHTKALGVYTTVGSYTLTAPAAATVNFLVIAGGGGGGGGGDGGSDGGGGGGGSGGYRTSVGTSGGGAVAESSLSLATAVAYSITVGTGGSAGVGGSPATSGGNGGNSVFSTITSSGGGGGGYNAVSGINGGSGGGAGGSNVSNGGTGTANQGRNGGTMTTNKVGGRGGGGASVAATNGGDVNGGAGGDGVANSITGVSETRGGGGGAGSRNNASGVKGLGGSGGGGAGADSGASAIVGTSNTGSGGGGATKDSPRNNGAVGGSGIVVFRAI